MSNIPDYILKAIDYLNGFLPTPTAVQKLNKTTKGKIPFGLSGAYDFYEAEILGTRFLLAGIEENEDDMPPTVIAKQREVLKNLTGLTPIFIFDKIASYLFPRYTKNGLNIIVSDRKIFLPSLFLIASKERNEVITSEDKVPYLFQLMVLFDLQKEKLDGMTMRDVATKLGTSYATVNRCTRWMKENGFIKLEGGKEKQIYFLVHGKELWNKALPFLNSPIDFVVYTPELRITDKSLISEQNALAEYSMLNGGPYRIAVSRDVYKDIKDKVYWDQFGEAGVEVWKYDPMLLSNNGIVDKLSLYLLLKDYEDERVQIELENMMNEIIW